MAAQAFLVRDGLRSGSTLVIDSSGNWVGNTITEVFGGTNQTTYTAGDILFASGANTLAKLGIAGNGDVLTLAGGVPSWATPVSAPNSFGFAAGDAGSPLIIANKTSDVLTITGGASITTSVSGSPAVLVITNDDPNVDQNIWLNFNADSGGPVAANTTTDTFTFTGGASITTVISGDVVTITNDDPNVDQNLFLNVASDAGTAVADTTTDTLSILGGTGISTAVTDDTLTITNDSPNIVQNLFETIRVFGSPTVDVVASTATDILTLTGGSGITLNVGAGSPQAILITNSDPNVDQNIWLNIDADSGGPVAANTTTDQITFTGGTSITTSISGDVLTIANDDPNVDQNIWLNIAADSGGPVAANTTTDTLTLTGGIGIVSAISGDAVTFTLAVDELSEKSGDLVGGDRLTGTSGTTNFSETISGIPLSIFSNDSNFAADQNLWLNIAADSGGPVAANTVTDTLTLTGGDGIATTISGDAVTFDVDDTVMRVSGSPVFASTVLTTTVFGGSPITTATVATHAIATFRSVEFKIQATRPNDFHSTNIVAIQGPGPGGGSPAVADFSEFGSLQLPSFFGSPSAGSPSTSGSSATYTVDINSGNMRLRATSRGGVGNITFKVISTLTSV